MHCKDVETSSSAPVAACRMVHTVAACPVERRNSTPVISLVRYELMPGTSINSQESVKMAKNSRECRAKCDQLEIAAASAWS